MLADIIGNVIKEYRTEILDQNEAIFAESNDLTLEELERIEKFDSTLGLETWEKALEILSLLNAVKDVADSDRLIMHHMSQQLMKKMKI